MAMMKVSLVLILFEVKDEFRLSIQNKSHTEELGQSSFYVFDPFSYNSI